jgi:hypothetical protein
MWSDRLFRKLSVVLLTGVLALGIGCGVDDSTTGVSDRSAADQQMPQLSASDNRALNEYLNAERARIREAQKANREVRDSLRQVWKQFKKDHPHLNRRNSPFPICEPDDYQAETKIIGPDGGEINIGRHRLIIPRGALEENTVITGEAPVSLLIEVELSPHGTVFLKQPKLQLDYSHCFLPSDYPYRVAYINNGEHILEFPVSVDKGGIVEALIWHFSRYAVAY